MILFLSAFHHISESKPSSWPLPSFNLCTPDSASLWGLSIKWDQQQEHFRVASKTGAKMQGWTSKLTQSVDGQRDGEQTLDKLSVTQWTWIWLKCKSTWSQAEVLIDRKGSWVKQEKRWNRWWCLSLVQLHFSGFIFTCKLYIPTFSYPQCFFSTISWKSLLAYWNS